ncbi:MAG: recombinase family protein [Actinomycetota bacterium]|nr:recombinase family protein [Actinomycetota bacterium]
MAKHEVQEEMRVLGYARVSTEDQVNGAGLDAQRGAIETDIERRGWQLVELVTDAGFSGKSLRRPGIVRALDLLDRREADVLMAAKLDRLSRSVKDFADMLDRAKRRGWQLIVLDVGVDTTTPQGEMMVNVLAAFAQFERRLIGQRTKEALAQKRAQGVVLGRPRKLSSEVAERIVTARAAGASLAAIARELTTSGVPTAQGGQRWYPSTVRAVLQYAAPHLLG